MILCSLFALYLVQCVVQRSFCQHIRSQYGGKEHEVNDELAFKSLLGKTIADTTDQQEISVFLESKDESFVTKLFRLSAALGKLNVKTDDANALLQRYGALENAKQEERNALFANAEKNVRTEFEGVAWNRGQNIGKAGVVKQIQDIERDSSLSENHKTQQQINVLNEAHEVPDSVRGELLPIINGSFHAELGANHPVHSSKTFAALVLPNYQLRHNDDQSVEKRLDESRFFLDRQTVPERKKFPQPTLHSFGDPENDDSTLEPPFAYRPTTPFPELKVASFSKETISFPTNVKFLGGNMDISPISKTQIFVAPYAGGGGSSAASNEKGNSYQNTGRPPTSSQTINGVRGFPPLSIDPINKKEILEERFRIDQNARYRGLPQTFHPITAGLKEYLSKPAPEPIYANTLRPDATIEEKFALESKKAQGSLSDRFVEKHHGIDTFTTGALTTTTTVYQGFQPYFGPESITGSLSRPYTDEMGNSRTRRPFKLDLRNE